MFLLSQLKRTVWREQHENYWTIYSKTATEIIPQAAGLIIHNYKWDTCFSNNSSYLETTFNIKHKKKKRCYMAQENKTSLFVFSWHLLCHQSSFPSFLSFCHLPLRLSSKPPSTTLNTGSDLFGYYFKTMFRLGCRSFVFCVHSSTYWVLVTQHVKFLTAHYLEW